MVAAAEGHTGVLELLLQVGKHRHTTSTLIPDLNPRPHHFDGFQQFQSNTIYDTTVRLLANLALFPLSARL